MKNLDRDQLVGFLLFLPLAVYMFSLSFYPIYRVFVMSFQELPLFTSAAEAEFAALSNFGNILQREAFWNSLRNSIVFSLGSLFFQMAVGLPLALLLNARFPLRNPVRGTILFSYLVPYVVAALTWRFMFSEATGILNFYITRSGLNIPGSWLGAADFAMPAVIMVNTWKNFPFMVLVFLSALQSIDPQLYEAAVVDGASRRQLFYHITLPMLLPTIIIVGMLRTIWNFNNFEVVYLLTQGGPLGRTETIPILIHRIVFGEFRLGRGSALALLGLIALVCMALTYWKVYEKTMEESL